MPRARTLYATIPFCRRARRYSARRGAAGGRRRVYVRVVAPLFVEKVVVEIAAAHAATPYVRDARIHIYAFSARARAPARALFTATLRAPARQRYCRDIARCAGESALYDAAGET